MLLVAGTDFDVEIKQLRATMKTIGQVLDLDGMRAEIADLGEQVAAPDLWDDQENAHPRHRSALRASRDSSTGSPSSTAGIDDVEIMVQLAQEEDDADSLAEAEVELAKIHKAVEQLEVRTLLSGEYDEREAIITIRSGAGGVDAADFAEMLMRMYTRWAERNKYPVEVFDTSYAEEAGHEVGHLRHPRAVRLRDPQRRGGHPPPGPDQPLRQPGPPADQRSPRSRWCRCSSRPT